MVSDITIDTYKMYRTNQYVKAMTYVMWILLHLIYYELLSPIRLLLNKCILMTIIYIYKIEHLSTDSYISQYTTEQLIK